MRARYTETRNMATKKQFLRVSNDVFFIIQPKLKVYIHRIVNTRHWDAQKTTGIKLQMSSWLFLFSFEKFGLFINGNKSKPFCKNASEYVILKKSRTLCTTNFVFQQRECCLSNKCTYLDD